MKFRPLAALAFAAFVPALALCVLQYRSLVELETKTAATARERLHEVLVTSAHQFETNVHDIAAAALSPIGAPEPPPGAELVRSFGESRRAQPAILEAFLVSQCACAGDPFVVLSSASETLEHAPLHHDRIHRLLRAYNAARVAGGFKYYVDAGDHARLYVFRTLDAQHVVFAGLTLDAAPLLQQSMQRSTAEPFAFSVADLEGHRVWESVAHASAPESDVRFGPMAAEWTLQARYTGATIETLAHRQFQRGLGLMALVVIALAFGATMTVRAANREARAAAMQTAFIANISHEMKTPLSLIRVCSETLQLGRVSDPGKLADYYELLRREARKLTSLIESVLEFGRMEAGRKEFRMSPGSVAEVVEQVMRDREMQFRTGGFETHVDIAPDLPPVNHDADALTQAVGNLVENAIKYSAERKTIAIGVSRGGSDVLIRVADAGIGIAPTEQQRIFDRFYRAGSPLVHNTKGSGLGLAIARHIVEAHGGYIGVESTFGEGSRFTIALPACLQPAAIESESHGVEACPRS